MNDGKKLMELFISCRGRLDIKILSRILDEVNRQIKDELFRK